MVGSSLVSKLYKNFYSQIISLDFNLQLKNNITLAITKRSLGASPLFTFSEIFNDDFWNLLKV